MPQYLMSTILWTYLVKKTFSPLLNDLKQHSNNYNSKIFTRDLSRKQLYNDLRDFSLDNLNKYTLLSYHISTLKTCRIPYMCWKLHRWIFFPLILFFIMNIVSPVNHFSSQVRGEDNLPQKAIATVLSSIRSLLINLFNPSYSLILLSKR